jgi:hypothetical protein
MEGMNKFWHLILKVRNFSHHWSVKQYGEKGAGSEYKFKFMVFITGYGATLIFIVLQTMFYFLGPQILPLYKTDPLPVKLLAASILIFLPIYLLTQRGFRAPIFTNFPGSKCLYGSYG